LAVNDAQDYLIITTNYDCLMELALEAAGVPFVVLWRSRNDEKIYNRFGNLPAAEIKTLEKRNPPANPESAVLKKNRGLAVIYKMHGCLYSELQDKDDGLVITDGD
jgi:hypothetical protein